MQRNPVVSRRALLVGMAAVAAGGAAACSGNERRGPIASPPPTGGGTEATESPGPSAAATIGSPVPSTGPPTGDYFPPATGVWDTVTATEAGFSADGLSAVVDLVGAANSQSLVILHEGRIVSEQYWMGATPETTRDLASCQKSVTSTLVGLARDRGLLQLDDPVSQYLPQGWTAAAADKEAAITIRHLLTMSSGLDERTLRATAAPGTVWEYNTAAYQKLRRVLEAAADTDINSLCSEWLFGPLHIDHPTAWAERPGGERTADAVGDRPWGLNLSARDMARFGLFAMHNGVWGGEQITAPGWFAEAWASSSVKRDYGFLWWLLGKGAFRRRGAPADLVAALGAQDQKVYVLPSAGLVLARQGDAAAAVVEAGSDFDAQLIAALLAARA